MRSSFEYMEKDKLILVQWTGNWDIEKYKESIVSFSEAIKDIDVKKVLQDIRNLDFYLDYEEVSQLTIIRENKFKQDFKVVYLTENPNQVVFSELYSRILPKKSAIEYCTTYKKAIQLLSISISETELKNKLEFLYNKMKA